MDQWLSHEPRPLVGSWGVAASMKSGALLLLVLQVTVLPVLLGGGAETEKSGLVLKRPSSMPRPPRGSIKRTKNGEAVEGETDLVLPKSEEKHELRDQKNKPSSLGRRRRAGHQDAGEPEVRTNTRRRVKQEKGASSESRTNKLDGSLSAESPCSVTAKARSAQKGILMTRRPRTKGKRLPQKRVRISSTNQFYDANGPSITINNVTSLREKPLREIRLLKTLLRHETRFRQLLLAKLQELAAVEVSLDALRAKMNALEVVDDDLEERRVRLEEQREALEQQSKRPGRKNKKRKGQAGQQTSLESSKEEGSAWLEYNKLVSTFNDDSHKRNMMPQAVAEILLEYKLRRQELNDEINELRSTMLPRIGKEFLEAYNLYQPGGHQ